jgi:predicted NBD/HSP70 family sugar kinase
VLRVCRFRRCDGPEPAHALGIGVATLGNLMNPQAIVLGGNFTQVADWIVAGIETEISNL